MKKIKIYLSLLFFISFIINNVFGQDENIKTAIKNADLLNLKAKQTMNKPDSLIHYGNLAYQLSKSINYANGEASLLEFIRI